jgi:hypothetical protein
MDELEFVQRKLLEVLVEETEKNKEKQRKTLINQLSKTIADNSKILAEFGMAPPVLYKIKSMIIPLNISTTNNYEKLAKNVKGDSTESNNPYGRLKMKYPESAIFPPIDNTDIVIKNITIKKNLQ